MQVSVCIYSFPTLFPPQSHFLAHKFPGTLLQEPSAALWGGSPVLWLDSRELSKLNASIGLGMILNWNLLRFFTVAWRSFGGTYLLNTSSCLNRFLTPIPLRTPFPSICSEVLIPHVECGGTSVGIFEYCAPWYASLPAWGRWRQPVAGSIFSQEIYTPFFLLSYLSPLSFIKGIPIAGTMENWPLKADHIPKDPTWIPYFHGLWNLATLAK
jgi:hypothetical protein